MAIVATGFFPLNEAPKINQNEECSPSSPIEIARSKIILDASTRHFDFGANASKNAETWRRIQGLWGADEHDDEEEELQSQINQVEKSIQRRQMELSFSSAESEAVNNAVTLQIKRKQQLWSDLLQKKDEQLMLVMKREAHHVRKLRRKLQDLQAVLYERNDQIRITGIEVERLNKEKEDTTLVLLQSQQQSLLEGFRQNSKNDGTAALEQSAPHLKMRNAFLANLAEAQREQLSALQAELNAKQQAIEGKTHEIILHTRDLAQAAMAECRRCAVAMREFRREIPITFSQFQPKFVIRTMNLIAKEAKLLMDERLPELKQQLYDDHVMMSGKDREQLVKAVTKRVKGDLSSTEPRFSTEAKDKLYVQLAMTVIAMCSDIYKSILPDEVRLETMRFSYNDKATALFASAEFSEDIGLYSRGLGMLSRIATAFKRRFLGFSSVSGEGEFMHMLRLAAKDMPASSAAELVLQAEDALRLSADVKFQKTNAHAALIKIRSEIDSVLQRIDAPGQTRGKELWGIVKDWSNRREIEKISQRVAPGHGKNTPRYNQGSINSHSSEEERAIVSRSAARSPRPSPQTILHRNASPPRNQPSRVELKNTPVRAETAERKANALVSDTKSLPASIRTLGEQQKRGGQVSGNLGDEDGILLDGIQVTRESFPAWVWKKADGVYAQPLVDVLSAIKDGYISVEDLHSYIAARHFTPRRVSLRIGGIALTEVSPLFNEMFHACVSSIIDAKLSDVEVHPLSASPEGIGVSFTVSGVSAATAETRLQSAIREGVATTVFRAHIGKSVTSVELERPSSNETPLSTPVSSSTESLIVESTSSLASFQTRIAQLDEVYMQTRRIRKEIASATEKVESLREDPKKDMELISVTRSLSELNQQSDTLNQKFRVLAKEPYERQLARLTEEVSDMRQRIAKVSQEVKNSENTLKLDREKDALKRKDRQRNKLVTRIKQMDTQSIVEIHVNEVSALRKQISAVSSEIDRLKKALGSDGRPSSQQRDDNFPIAKGGEENFNPIQHQDITIHTVKHFGSHVPSAEKTGNEKLGEEIRVDRACSPLARISENLVNNTAMNSEHPDGGYSNKRPISVQGEGILSTSGYRSPTLQKGMQSNAIGGSAPPHLPHPHPHPFSEKKKPPSESGSHNHSPEIGDRTQFSTSERGGQEPSDRAQLSTSDEQSKVDAAEWRYPLGMHRDSPSTGHENVVRVRANMPLPTKGGQVDAPVELGPVGQTPMKGQHSHQDDEMPRGRAREAPPVPTGGQQQQPQSFSPAAALEKKPTKHQGNLRKTGHFQRIVPPGSQGEVSEDVNRVLMLPGSSNTFTPRSPPWVSSQRVDPSPSQERAKPDRPQHNEHIMVNRDGANTSHVHSKSHVENLHSGRERIIVENDPFMPVLGHRYPQQQQLETVKVVASAFEPYESVSLPGTRNVAVFVCLQPFCHDAIVQTDWNGSWSKLCPRCSSEGEGGIRNSGNKYPGPNRSLVNHLAYLLKQQRSIEMAISELDERRYLQDHRRSTLFRTVGILTATLGAGPHLPAADLDTILRVTTLQAVPQGELGPARNLKIGHSVNRPIGASPMSSPTIAISKLAPRQHPPRISVHPIPPPPSTPETYVMKGTPLPPKESEESKFREIDRLMKETRKALIEVKVSPRLPTGDKLTSYLHLSPRVSIDNSIPIVSPPL